MQKAVYIFLLVILSLALHAIELDSTSVNKGIHSVSFSGGINQMKEELLHPKVHTGTIFQLGYGFEKRMKLYHTFNFNLRYSRLKTKLEDLSKSVNLQINTNYSFRYSLYSRKNFEYFLGPEFQICYNASFLPNWDDSHLYWASYYSIAAGNTLFWDLNNGNQCILTFSFPLFSVFSRPETERLYKIDDTDFSGIVNNLNSNLTAAHLVNVFYLRLNTEYRFGIFKNKHEAFTYSFEWSDVKRNDSKAFYQIINQIGIKIYL